MTSEELRGNAGTSTTGGAAKACTCPGDAKTRGGQGGAPDATADAGQSFAGGSGTPDHSGPGGEGGTPGASCNPTGFGSDGASATNAPDAAGATVHGRISETTWLTASGGAGSDGQPGQGGGGGAGKSAGGGGSGGCGACGGAGGPGGGGGGASIALLAVDSPVALNACALQTADAGDGGNGATGQAGQDTGGGRGRGFGDSNAGCDGGQGGKGGAGGAGGGGAGGVSVGIVHSGAKPTPSADTAVTTGAPGVKGNGAVPGANDGIDGVAQKELALP